MRFHSESSNQKPVFTKNKEFVSFPIKGLNLSSVMSEESKEDCIYDLYGVIHHSGSKSFGYNYATIKNDINSEDWYLFKGKFIF